MSRNALNDTRWCSEHDSRIWKINTDISVETRKSKSMHVASHGIYVPIQKTYATKGNVSRPERFDKLKSSTLIVIRMQTDLIKRVCFRFTCTLAEGRKRRVKFRPHILTRITENKPANR